jgi:DNA-directed RNA polymerase specialized sigma24 family protein
LERDKIIEELYLMKEVDDCIRFVVGSTYFDDFKQELFVRLIEHGNKLEEAYKANEHRYYVTRIIINLARRKRDIFHKKFIQEETNNLPEHYEVIDDNDIGQRLLNEQEEERILAKIDSIEHDTGRAYYRMLIEALKSCGSYRELSRRTGIPVASISGHMKLIRQHLCKK